MLDHTECWAEQQSRHAYLLVVPSVVVVLYQQSIHISHSDRRIQRLLIEKGTALTHTLLRVLLVEAAGEEENTRPLIHREDQSVRNEYSASVYQLQRNNFNV